MEQLRNREDMTDMPTVGSMIKKLEKVSSGINTMGLLADLFECGAIVISNRFDMKQVDERERRYIHIMSKYDEKTRNLIVELFTDICVLITNQENPSVGFKDYLGELYMKSETSSKQAGQFFTPYHISRLCASCGTDKEKVLAAKKNDEILTINEPSCGSAGMIIAAVDVLYNEYEFDVTRNLFVNCTDIDSRCVHMAYIQLGLAGIPAIIRKKNPLTGEEWECWLTPSLIMQWTRFRKYVTGGKNLQRNERRKPWAKRSTHT